MNEFPMMMQELAMMYNKPAPQQQDCAYLLQKHDKNRDGKMNIDEFKDMIRSLENATSPMGGQQGMPGQMGGQQGMYGQQPQMGGMPGQMGGQQGMYGQQPQMGGMSGQQQPMGGKQAPYGQQQMNPAEMYNQGPQGMGNMGNNQPGMGGGYSGGPMPK